MLQRGLLGYLSPSFGLGWIGKARKIKKLQLSKVANSILRSLQSSGDATEKAEDNPHHAHTGEALSTALIPKTIS